MTSECVYVIGAPGCSTVKIGRTTDLSRRLGAIQRMSPLRLQVLWQHPGGPQLETWLHRKFKALRSHGEWFIFEGDAVAQVKEAAALCVPSSAARKPVQRMPNLYELPEEEARSHIAEHLATHTPREWCQTCELWPHAPLRQPDGWCSRCDAHANDHDDTIWSVPPHLLPTESVA